MRGVVVGLLFILAVLGGLVVAAQLRLWWLRWQDRLGERAL
jgi:hypothetical protein